MQDNKVKALQLLRDESDTFVHSIETLRRLMAVAHPHARTLDENPEWREAMEKAKESLSRDKWRVFLVTMVEATPFVMSVMYGVSRAAHSNDNDPPTEWTPGDASDIVPEGELRDEFVTMREEMRAELSDDAVHPDFEIMVNDGRSHVKIRDPHIRAHFWAVIDRMERMASTPSHGAMLARSALTMAVSAFEVLVGNLYRAHISANPGAAEDPSVKAFSLNDLYAFGSVEDAIAETVFQQADKFSRRGVREWTDWFKGKPLSIDLSGMALDWERTKEIFERRNVVVHNGSRATRQYLQNVHPSLLAEIQEGTPLEVSPEYVDRALSDLLTAGSLLAFQVRFKLFGRTDHEATSAWIEELAFSLLLDDQFEVVAKIANRACAEELVQLNRQLLQVNGWIARARMSGLESIRESVAGWDTSALTLNFRMAKAVLLDEQTAALELIQEALAEDSITISNLVEWPLFHWLREAGQLDRLISDDLHLQPDLAVEPSDSDDRPELPPSGPDDIDHDDEP